MHRGACLCGAVSFEVAAPLRPPDACHCSRCRKLSGHYWVSTDAARADVTIRGGEHVTWYATSEKVRRGFCSVCGATLFWDPVQKDTLAIAMGAFESPTGTRLALHIHTADKGDYYELTDGLPQNLH